MKQFLFFFSTLFCVVPILNAQQVSISTLQDSICKGSSTTLSIPGHNNSVFWFPGDGLNTSLGSSVIASPGKTTTYLVSKRDTAFYWEVIVSGTNHTIALKADGTLWGWGTNSAGQVGDSTTATKSEPVRVSADTDWSKISAGDNSSYAIKANGTLWAWGSNTGGQLGDGTTVNKLIPTQIGTDADWMEVSGGATHTLAVKNDGSLWAWGNNTSSKLGDETTIQRNAPIRIGVDFDWKSVAAGSVHSIGIKQNGTYYGWGSNANGQLGDGTLTSKNVPTYISGWGVDSSLFWVSISAGGNSTLGIKANGTLWAWGTNSNGQLGDNSIIQKTSPTLIGSNWVKAIMRPSFSIGLRSDGSIWAWGNNANGQLGDGTITNRLVPTRSGTDSSWMNISAGTSFSFGIKKDSTIYAWGNNANGQLGFSLDNIWPQPIMGHSQFVKVYPGLSTATFAIKADGSLWSWGSNTNGQLGDSSALPTIRTAPVRIGTDTNWAEIFARNGTVIALKTDGTLWSWGGNTNGQLGDGTVVSKLKPAQIGTETNWTNNVTLTGTSCLAIKKNGTLWAWGLNTSGQLGDGTSVNKSVPVQIGADTNWSFISIAGTSSYGLKTDGSAWAWGVNSSGNLGDGTATSRLSPVSIGIDNNWGKLIIGGASNFGFKKDGTLWAWGSNVSGQLGDGTITNRPSPIQFGTDTSWQSVSALPNSVFCIKKNGTLWACGSNTLGQLGDGTLVNKSIPVQIGTDSNWSIVQANSTSVYGLKKDGSLWAWGSNVFRQLGDGTKINRSSPIRVLADTNWANILTSGSSTFALKTDSTLWAWGLNSTGQSGNGLSPNQTTPSIIMTLDTGFQRIVVDTFNMKFSVNTLGQCLTGNTFMFNNGTTANTGIHHHVWYFGNGDTSALTHPAIGYANSGNYAVKLVSTSNYGCKDSLTKTVKVFPKPAVGFTINDSTQCLSGNHFLLSDTSSILTGTLLRTWNFGNGDTSTQLNPAVTYTTSGTYQVKLKLTSSEGCKDSVVKTINVYAKPQAGFATNDSGQCLTGNQFLFNDTSSVLAGNGSRVWSFGNGDTSTQIAPSIIYATAGNYEVKLLFTNADGCNDSLTKTMKVYAMPSIGFTVNNPNQCLQNNQFLFNDTSSVLGGNVSRVWNFGNGDTSTQTSRSMIYITSGNYQVKLVSTSADGCKDSLTKMVNVYAAPQVGFTVNNAEQCLNNNQFVFNDTSSVLGGSVSRVWHFGNGDTSTQINRSVNYAASGNYEVKLLAQSADGCIDSIAKIVTVYAKPSVGFTVNDADQCLNTNQFLFNDTSSALGANVSRVWSLHNGDTSTQANLTRVYASAGDFVVKLLSTSNYGCKDSLSKTVTVFANPSAGFTLSQTSQCFNNNVFLISDTSQFASGSFERHWDFGNGYASTNKNAQINYDHPANYMIKLMVTSNDGCKDSMLKQVNVYPNPVAGFTMNKSLQCLNNNQFIFADTSSVSSGVLSYFWHFGNGDTSTTNSPVFTYKNGGAFNVKLVVTTEFSCKDSVTAQITVTTPVAQALCLITVDSTLGKNVLVWERSNKSVQTGYKIYKETAVPNTYEHIGYVSSDSSGIYIDTASTPNTKADSYVITAIDSCGGESEKSAIHKPFHLDITAGGASVVLNWGAYQGLTGNTILIYRGSSAGTMSLIASVQGSVSSYTDLAPINGINYYMIAMDFGKTCDPGIFQAPPITVTTSNIVSALFTGVEDLSNIAGLKLYPNPTNKLVNLEFEALEGNSAIEIFDISGKSVYQSTFTHNRGSFKQSFDISALQTGVYIAKITCGNQSKNVKLLVN